MNKTIALLLGITPSIVFAAKSYEVDPQHYQVMFENDCVVVVHAKYGPGESNAAPYETSGGVVVMLSDASFERESEDGKKVSGTPKAGNAWWIPPVKVKTLTNTGDQPSEWIGVVPKGKAGCEK